MGRIGACIAARRNPGVPLVAATDNDTVNGPKIGRSATRSVRMPTLQEVVSAAAVNERSAESSLKSALERQKQLERKLERQKQTPREEGPPMLAEYEINRIMVEDPRDHLKRAASALGQLQQALGAQARAVGGEGSQNAGRTWPRSRPRPADAGGPSA